MISRIRGIFFFFKIIKIEKKKYTNEHKTFIQCRYLQDIKKNNIYICIITRDKNK